MAATRPLWAASNLINKAKSTAPPDVVGRLDRSGAP